MVESALCCIDDATRATNELHVRSFFELISGCLEVKKLPYVRVQGLTDDVFTQ